MTYPEAMRSIAAQMHRGEVEPALRAFVALRQAQADQALRGAKDWDEHCKAIARHAEANEVLRIFAEIQALIEEAAKAAQK